jgi:hypothetical protein
MTTKETEKLMALIEKTAKENNVSIEEAKDMIKRQLEEKRRAAERKRDRSE